MPRPVVDPRFGVTLRAARLERGLSLREVARLAAFGKSYLQELEVGIKQPTLQTAHHLDEVLAAGGLLATLVHSPSAPPEADPKQVRYALAGSGRVPSGAVESLAVLLAHQRRLEDAVGSAALVGPVLAQTNMLRKLATQATGARAWRQFLVVAAEWACYAGWLTATTGRHAAGHRWYRQSRTWAELVGHPDLESSALQMEGHLAWVQGRYADMIALSQAAAERGRGAGVRSVAVQQEARGLALVGDALGCRRQLSAAEDLASAASNDPDAGRDWLYYYDGAYLCMQSGLAALYLSQHEKAVEQITAGLSRLPDVIRTSDWVSWYLVRLAEAQAGTADLEAAAASLGTARSTGQRTAAARLLADVDDVSRRLRL
jgi:transcriptional regulator with XRE-family HTH domain